MARGDVDPMSLAVLVPLKRVHQLDLLGVTVADTGSFHNHVARRCATARNVARQCAPVTKRIMARENGAALVRNIFSTLISSVLFYGAGIHLPPMLRARLVNTYHECARILTGHEATYVPELAGFTTVSAEFIRALLKIADPGLLIVERQLRLFAAIRRDAAPFVSAPVPQPRVPRRGNAGGAAAPNWDAACEQLAADVVGPQWHQLMWSKEQWKLATAAPVPQ